MWGHAYQHLLMRYMTKLRDYSPDLVISLDGANELPMISKLTEIGITSRKVNSITFFTRYSLTMQRASLRI